MVANKRDSIYLCIHVHIGLHTYVHGYRHAFSQTSLIRVLTGVPLNANTLSANVLNRFLYKIIQ